MPVKTCTLKNAKEVKIGGSKYCLANLGTSLFGKAKSACRALNARLPLPRNDQETKDLLAAFKVLNITPQRAKYGTGPVILGITDTAKGLAKGPWVDNDGNPLTYTNWGPSQPNHYQNIVQDYAGIYDLNGKWGDYQDNPALHGWSPGKLVCLQQLDLSSGTSRRSFLSSKTSVNFWPFGRGPLLSKYSASTNNQGSTIKPTSPVNKAVTFKPVKTCTLQNAKQAIIGGHTFCLAKLGTSLYSKAEEACKAVNAKLPLPKSDQETSDLMTALKMLGITTNGIGSSIELKNPVILGITDSTKGLTKGTWVDNNGNPLTYTNWKVGQPNHYQNTIAQDYASIIDYIGKWGDFQDDPAGTKGWRAGQVVCLQQLDVPKGNVFCLVAY